MKTIVQLLLFTSLFLFIQCKEEVPTPPPTVDPTANIPQGEKEHLDSLISKIAFGSCGHQDRSQPILGLAASKILMYSFF